MENNISVAVKALIVHNRKALIIKRSDYIEFAAGVWEFVGGGIEFGEELIEALKREVREETGMIIEMDRILYATTSRFPTSQRVFITYLCHTDDDSVVLSNEHTDYLWVTKQQLCEMLSPDILCDIKTYALDSLEIDAV